MRNAEIRLTRTIGQLLIALNGALKYYFDEYDGWRQLNIVQGDFTTKYEKTPRRGYRLQGVALTLPRGSRKFSLLCFRSRPQELNVAPNEDQTTFTFYVESGVARDVSYPITIGFASKDGTLIDGGWSLQELPDGPRS